MTPEEMERIYNSEALRGQMGQNAMATQQQLLFQEQERGLAEEQLDVEEILDRLHNLFQGKQYKDVGQGVKEWIEPTDTSMKTLSEWGVQRMMQIARFHINKNTLLSNYDEPQIQRCMYHFTTELNDLVLLKYKQLFREPSFEECKKILQTRMDEKGKLRELAFELLGKTANKIQIKQDIINEMEGKIEREMQKIKEEQLKERIKEYGLLCWELESCVYSTYRRAYMGKERETLRRHASFSEIRTAGDTPQKKGGLTGWLRA